MNQKNRPYDSEVNMVKQLYGLLGEKLGHSLSPFIHSCVFEKLKLEGNYHLFEVERRQLENAFKGLKALGLKGVNITIPYKKVSMEYMDEISKEAKEIGAINTVAINKEQLIGYNTDYDGFGKMLKYFDVEIKDKRALILGTGGVSKAVLKYLEDHKIGDIILVSRDKAKGKKEYPQRKVVSYEDLKNVKERELLINCTPIGMHPKIENSPVDKEIISRCQWAIDLIYNPEETLFLKYAKEVGVSKMNGLYMLVGQAVKAQEIWNEIEISSKITEEIYKKILCEGIMDYIMGT